MRYGPTSGGYSRGGRSISKPRNLRGFRDASGQLVFDPDDENLSDKELYARNIPAIGIMTCCQCNVCAVLLWPSSYYLYHRHHQADFNGLNAAASAALAASSVCVCS